MRLQVAQNVPFSCKDSGPIQGWARGSSGTGVDNYWFQWKPHWPAFGSADSMIHSVLFLAFAFITKKKNHLRQRKHIKWRQLVAEITLKNQDGANCIGLNGTHPFLSVHDQHQNNWHYKTAEISVNLGETVKFVSKPRWTSNFDGALMSIYNIENKLRRKGPCIIDHF